MTWKEEEVLGKLKRGTAIRRSLLEWALLASALVRSHRQALCNYLYVHVHGPQHRIVEFFLLRQWIRWCWFIVQLPSWP